VVGRRRAGRAAAAHTGQDGYALLVALLVVFMVSVALSLIALSLAVQMRSAREEARGTVLTSLCDAALAEALSAIAAGGRSGLPQHAFGDGLIGSNVLAIDALHFTVTATATYGGKGRAVQAQVVRDAGGTRVVAWQRLSG
jgi:hypothetical protein